MEKLIIKNGFVFDPINDIQGERKDILIEGGKIVENFSNESDIKEIDAIGKTVIPAALDVHTHVASQKVSWARLLGSNNTEFKNYWEGLTLKKIAKDYISNGYTFILEANVFPSLSKQTIFNFKQIPVLDKGMLLNISNFWVLELEFLKNKIEDAGAFLSDLLHKTKGFGFKIYNPFESEIWNFKELRENLSQTGRLYNFTPMEIYKAITKIVEYLGLPHSVHAHIEGYEQQRGKSNLKQVLEEILELKSNLKSTNNLNRTQIFHIAHANSYNLDGDNEFLINLLNNNKAININIGCIGFDPINPLITSDRGLIKPLIMSEAQELSQLFSSAVESEGDSFVSLRRFDKKNKIDCILWANALDLALNIKDKYQVNLSFNYPNYSDVNNLPEIATWLVSKEARLKFMDDMDNAFLKDNSMINNDTSLTFNEFVIISRSSPAKTLGLGLIKGNLGVGADGDLNILNININNLDLNKEYSRLKNALSNIEYVIKAGKTVKKGELIDFDYDGKIFWTEGNNLNRDKSLIMKKKEEFYSKYYSTFYDSLKITIEDKYLRKIE